MKHFMKRFQVSPPHYHTAKEIIPVMANLYQFVPINYAPIILQIFFSSVSKLNYEDL